MKDIQRLCLIGLLFFWGCDQEDQEAYYRVMQRTKPECIAAQGYLEKLLDHQIDNLSRAISPKIVDKNITEKIRYLSLQFPNEKPISIKLVNILQKKGIKNTNDVQQYSIHFQCEFSLKRYFHVNITLDKKNNQQYDILGMQVNPLPDSLEKINSFNRLITSTHIFFFILIVFLPLFTLYALIQCLRTRIKWKILWIFFILFGMMHFKFNWSTGQAYINPIAIQLFSFGFVKHGLYAPWILTTSIPLGSIIFLLKRHKILKLQKKDRDTQIEHDKGNDDRPEQENMIHQDYDI